MGLVVRLNGVQFPDSLPRLERDPLIVPGTLLLHDYSNAYGYPAQAAPTAQTATIRDLVRGGNDATILNPTAWAWDTAGGLIMPTARAAGQHILAPHLDLTNRDVVVVVWWRAPAVAANYAGIIGQAKDQGGSNAENQFFIDSGADGLHPRVRFWLQNSEANTEATLGAVTPGGPHQLAFSLQAASGGMTLRTYLDGTQTAEQLVGFMTSLAPTPRPVTIGAAAETGTSGAGTVYRALIEDLTASGRSPGTVVQADWARR